MKMSNYIPSPKAWERKNRCFPLKQNTFQSLILSSLKRHEFQQQLSLTANRSISQASIKTKWYYPIFFQGQKYRDVIRFHCMYCLSRRNFPLPSILLVVVSPTRIYFHSSAMTDVHNTKKHHFLSFPCDTKSPHSQIWLLCLSLTDSSI